MSFWEQMRKRLTDVFKKNPESNISKFLRLAAEPMDEIEAVLWQIHAWRDLDQAEGTTLDLIGSNVGQPRGVVSDPIYRALIRSKIARNLSTGTLDSIIEVLALALDSDPSTIKLEELSEDEVDPKPAAIRVAGLPYNRLDTMGISTTQFLQLVKSVVSPGVQVESIEFSGTLRLSDVGAAKRPGLGLGDDAKTTGGTLGNVYAGDDTPELPI
ncbi:hypothetical protein PM3016_5427 [Paenibacillus mucilaginosus 3016]|uniref:Uncharacterized protein n=1 Tax=Paenibacillus mucilaginosus 3016 TaxID=1116391 RepID=H6NDS8_9BACL|nr:hypothetical protein [Paenibacillus mucilaginosus]AFC32127.1 hypothetical protein PM3016_5427 [Paenibacillus mucilaginosus 3016]WFA20630.1 hypothetical protein ERY13_27015 [Paenibacillus mucilaginosus]